MYCLIILHSNHISIVALAPLAIYAYINTANFFMSYAAVLRERFPNPITSSLVIYLSILSQQRINLEYTAAAAECLTFPILLWRWISGISAEVSFLDVVLLFQFLHKRYSVSDKTRRIIEIGVTSCQDRVKKFASLFHR